LSVREAEIDKLPPTNEVDTRDRISIIVDTCIGELSSPHIKPVLYYSFNDNKFEVLLPGNIQIWGRTCMEFDKLLPSISLPKNTKNISIGDYFLFAASGAYDVSMSYNFGDGISRSI
jgi:diaminopimelate decarboxylase